MDHDRYRTLRQEREFLWEIFYILYRDTWRNLGVDIGIPASEFQRRLGAIATLQRRINELDEELASFFKREDLE